MINYIKTYIYTLYEVFYTAVSYLLLYMSTSPDTYVYGQFGILDIFLILLFGIIACYGTLKIVQKKKK